MKERFRGKALVEGILRQDLVTCNPRAAKEIADKCSVHSFRAGTEFIREGTTTSDVFLILQGTVDVRIRGLLVATRTAGQHVGEMAALLNSRRTASAIARDEVIAAKLSRTAFLNIGDKFSSIWREIARTLAIRLDQRRDLIREQNLKPRIFVISASESKDIAHALKSSLHDPRWEIEVWDEQQVFTPSHTFIRVLTERARKSDFGIAIFGKDDLVTKRKKRMWAARDNVVFEAGLFIGEIGLERTFLLFPDNALHRPSDLEGVVSLKYSKRARRVDVGEAVKKLRGCVEALGLR